MNYNYRISLFLVFRYNNYYNTFYINSTHIELIYVLIFLKIAASLYYFFISFEYFFSIMFLAILMMPAR